jgi:hypothetical protein
MQLWQLGLLVVGGVSLIVYLVHAAGGSRTAMLANTSAAIARFAEDYPDEVPSSVHLTKDNSAAFLALPEKTVGLIHPVGDCFLTRIITADDVKNISASAENLTLKIADFSFTGGAYKFASEAERQAVQTLLENMGAQHA